MITVPPSTLKLASWNINSVRLRIGLVERFLTEHAPDVLCLQEIKCQNDQFPAKALAKLGYKHTAVHGQKGYHGVATVSKRPLTDVFSTDYVSMGDTRHLACSVETALGPVRIHNFYVPAGGDVADVVTNPKFDHKLKFLDEMKTLTSSDDGVPAVLVGDLNIAPLETDVWSHKQLLKVVSHTLVETDGLNAVQEAGAWVDVVREKIDPAEKVFSWWSYRARDWDAADKGRRLDHIWADQRISDTVKAVEILREARGWEKPSDHVPVIATFAI
ncbi:MAG: exodeoxyribonuclease III [Pseudomonadota bacterium]